jgi:hypothetical protein
MKAVHFIAQIGTGFSTGLRPVFSNVKKEPKFRALELLPSSGRSHLHSWARWTELILFTGLVTVLVFGISGSGKKSRKLLILSVYI